MLDFFKKLFGVKNQIVKNVHTPTNYIGFTDEDMQKLDIVYVDDKGNVLNPAQQKALKGQGFIPPAFLRRRMERGL